MKQVVVDDTDTKMVLEFPDLDLTDEQKTELQDALQ